jgi:hypothetical protein
MIDGDHPVIRKLVNAGFKISLHAYLKANGVHTSITAFRKEPRLSIQGRSRSGDVAEALADLEIQVSSPGLWP